jgi:nucleoside-diphosphate-sugar epimerase
LISDIGTSGIGSPQAGGPVEPLDTEAAPAIRSRRLKIFLGGATGAIGRPLVRLLVQAGHKVVGTTRSPSKVEALCAAGAEPVIVDVFDAPALAHAVASARPDVLVHQLTDLPRGLDPSQMSEGARRNARVRDEGTRNLVAAAREAGVLRMIAQSIAWMYAPGREPHGEDDLLDLNTDGTRAISVAGVVALEQQVLSSPPIEGVVLRYGHLYGPGTGTETAALPSVHVDAAAEACLLAIGKARPGVYNVAEPSDYLSIDKARRELGFDPAFRVAR